MPNHCESDLVISGDAKLLKTIIAKHFTEEGELNCDSVIPYPKKFKKLDEAAAKYEKEHPGDWAGRPKDGFNQGGYDWCCNNWGTKWGTYDGTGICFSKKKDRVSVSFQSAWAPPTPVVAKLAKMYPDATFEMDSFECGMGFQVSNTWANGESGGEVQSDYSGTRGG